MLQDPAVTTHEKANAAALKARLEEELKEQSFAGEGWTELAFRAGRAVRKLKTSTAPPPALNGTSKLAFRLGRIVGQGLKKRRPT